MQALPCTKLTQQDEELLNKLVCFVLFRGMQSRELELPAWEIPASLQQPAATFVTLYCNKQLQGCIGSIVASRPLWRDVADRTFASAFNDRRFNPLKLNQLTNVEFNISILSELKRLAVVSEQELITMLVTNPVGLMLTDGSRSSLFLPSVWEHFTHPKQFLQALKQKAGWSEDYWSPTMQVSYFNTSCVDGVYLEPGG